MHIGLIGGIGPAATSFYYERIARAFNEAGQTLDLTMAHTSARTLTANVPAGRAEEEAAEYVRVTTQLAAAGAERVVITSMGGHFCLSAFAPISPLPLIEGPKAVGEYLVASGIRRIGILGTRIVMQTKLYGALSALEAVAPEGEALDQANDDYIAVAVRGWAK